MEKSIHTLLNTVKLVDVLTTTGLFIILIGFLLTQRKNLKAIFENWRKKRNFEDTIMNAVEKNTSKINYLEDTMIKARETSKDIRAELYDDLKEVSNDVKGIIDVLGDIQEKERQREEKERLSKQANAKEKIEKIYRECSEAQLITDTQFETLEDLISDYERYGGENSFVHSLVQKEMYKWRKIKKIPKQ